MLKRFQAAFAIALLVLTASFGQAGIRQCLCTGQIAHDAVTTCECTEAACCEEYGQPSQAPPPPCPCEDDTCWLLISIDDADQPPLHITTPVPSAASTPEFTDFAKIMRSPLVRPIVWQHRPPHRQTIPFTVLLSSFLI